MNQREKVLAILTVIVILVGGAVMLLPEDMSLGGGFAGDLDAIEQTFDSHYETLRRGPVILAEFRRLNTRLPEQSQNRTSEATFSDEISRMLKSGGWARPRIAPAKQSFIEDVDDYYFIDLEVDVEGTLPDLIALMTDFQRTNILVKEYSMTKPRMDEGEVKLTIIVSRLAKMDAEMIRERAKSRR